MKKIFAFLLIAVMLASSFMLCSCSKHEWNDTEIITLATPDTDGSKIVTCSECGKSKTISYSYEGMTEEEWNACFSASSLNNYTYTEISSTTFADKVIESTTVYKFTEDASLMSTSSESGETNTEVYTGANAAAAKKMMRDSILEITPYSNYRYDKKTNTYVKDGKIVSDGSVEIITSSVKFENGKVSEIKFSCNIPKDGIKVRALVTITFSDFGITVIQ